MQTTVTIEAVRSLLREGRWAWSAHAEAVGGYSRTGNLVIVTVYEPTMPKWRDPQTRNR